MPVVSRDYERPQRLSERQIEEKLKVQLNSLDAKYAGILGYFIARELWCSRKKKKKGVCKSLQNK